MNGKRESGKSVLAAQHTDDNDDDDDLSMNNNVNLRISMGANRFVFL